MTVMKKCLLVLSILLSAALGAEARDTYILNNDWRFFFKEENSSDEARYVRLPHTWNLDALTGDGSYRQTTANYLRTLFIPADWNGKRLFLRFHGVQSVADVFLNGTHIGEHRGGWTAFTFEITDKVRFGSDNTLLVVVSNNYQNDVLPTSTEMNLYGGIYRDVELVVTDKLAVSPVYYGTDGVLVHQNEVSSERAEGSVGVMLIGKKDAPCNVTVDIVSPDGYVAVTKSVKAKADGKMLNIPFSIDNPELWSPKRPNLYKVSVMVGSDSVGVVTGFRKIECTPERKFTVNGKRQFIHGVTLCHDRVPSGSALTDKDYDADLRIIRETGANAIRSAVGPHAQYLYDLCDQQGIVVWIDCPLTQAPFLSDMAYFATPRFEENGRRQLQEIIVQNYNHPSVAMWGIFSLLRGTDKGALEYVRELNALAKSLDKSRPTVACSNQDGEINFITDLIVWQQNVGWSSGSTEDLTVWQSALSSHWNHLAQAVCFGEGGTYGQQNESYVKRGSSSLHRIPESWQTRFHEGYMKYIGENLFWGVWINTMFDFGSARYRAGVRNTGLVSFDRAQRKDAYYLYRTLWNRSMPTLHIVGKNRDIRMRTSQCFTVYSSGDAPILTVNGDTVAVRRMSQGVFRSDSVALKGRNDIRAWSGDCADSMVLTIGSYLKRRQ